MTETVVVGVSATQSFGTNRIDRFLSILPKRNGSDLHLAVGGPPMLRIDGRLERIRFRALTEGDFYNLIGPDHAAPALGGVHAGKATPISPTRWATSRASASTCSGRSAARRRSFG